MLSGPFLCERFNLVNIEDILLRFCLKNDKNIYPLLKNNDKW